MEPNTLDSSDDERVLLTDGGSDEDGSEDEQNETESEAESSEEAEEVQESESQDTDEEEAEGTTVLHLDLQGLFLNVLGLEVDLDEVVLDIDAVPGSGNLLGNLLSGVSGLLDMDMGSLASKLPLIGGSGEEGEDEGGSMLSGMGESVTSKASDITDDLPLEDLVSQLLTELVSQLLDGSDDSTGQAEDGGGEEAEASA